MACATFPRVLRTRVLALLLSAPALTTVPAAAQTLPDLTPDIFDVGFSVGNVDHGDFVEGCAGGETGRTLLRFSLRTRNIGAGDLEIGDPSCPDCAQNPGEICANSLFECSEAHGHPHFDGFVRVELLDAGGGLVGVSHKVGFCLLDLECPNPRYSCGFQGISAGCSDVYDSSLPCQYIDLTGVSLPDGLYTLRATVDPNDVFPEADESNNTTTATVRVGPEQANCPVYASTDVPRAVPDLGSATSTLEVPAGHPITNLRVVGLRGTHAYVHDLEMRLRSPSGTTVSVFDRPCAGDYDDFSLDLADDASTSMPCPPTDAAPHVPSHPLAAFVGEPANGTWSLEVIDHEAQDTGTLEGWGLAICGPCGNGVLDPGETCDDGNALDGDCCSADCTSAAGDGVACSDGNACTAGDSCSQGRCAGGAPVVCDPCLTCYSSVGCAPPATNVCLAAAAGKSRITLKRRANPSGDFLNWMWKPVAPVPSGDFGLPESSTDLALCVFDANGLQISSAIPAGAVCRGAPCWSRGADLRYRDRDLARGGLKQISLRAGSEKRARISALGQGPGLELPSLDLVPPVTVRLKRGNGSPLCWQSTYGSAQRRTTDLFKAKSE